MLAARRARPFRALGWAAVVVFIVLAGSVSKPYYFAPALTILFPAAGAAIEAWTPGRAAGAVRLVIMLLAASTLAAAPLAKPILSEDAYVRYAAALGIAPASDEKHRLGRLPQFFADMHGWRALAETVAGVAAHLPPEERTQACVYANNYGEAAAIDFYRAEFSLPPAISGHNNYWLWGPGACSGTVLIIIGGNREQHERWFRTVEQRALSSGAPTACPQRTTSRSGWGAERGCPPRDLAGDEALRLSAGTPAQIVPSASRRPRPGPRIGRRYSSSGSPYP